ncbi:uncharacterized protein LOC118405677 [Branchiostoma floridae]|uniref:Uncharacterized protein LOC118405677 n=1 Tax=Branchiostoma floridae TaxID=7739 RepID=A0A9J7HKQ5_BRAFL|nr:uncharacterized protein LOC118405677 [Branchiostoma floridae]XP_035661174.1 uncharacterized protein LOC118405677 [Branchiostoma floridae]XP_035661175.1 uncharacterized protein LOC118405677 [Branchiostoma floridae]
MATNSPHIHRQEAVKWEGPSTSTSGVLVSSGGTNRLPTVCPKQTRSEQVKNASNTAAMPQMLPEMQVLRNGRQNNADSSHMTAAMDGTSAKQSLEKLRQMRQRLHSDEDLKPNSYDKSKHPRTLSDGAYWRPTSPQAVNIVHNSYHGPVSPPAIANSGDNRFSFERGSPNLFNMRQASLDFDVSSEPASRISTPISVDTPPISASTSPVASPRSLEGVMQDGDTSSMSYRKLWQNRSIRKKSQNNQDSKPSLENGSRKVFKRGESSPTLFSRNVVTEKQLSTQNKERQDDRTTSVDQSECDTISEHLDTGSSYFRRSSEGNSTRRSLRAKYPKAMQHIPSFNEFRRMRKEGHVSPSSKFSSTLFDPVEENEDCSSVAENAQEKEPEKRVSDVARRDSAELAISRSVTNGNYKKESREKTEVTKLGPQDSSKDMRTPHDKSEEVSKDEEKSILSILSTYYAKEGARSMEVCKEKDSSSQNVSRKRDTDQQSQDLNSCKSTPQNCFEDNKARDNSSAVQNTASTIPGVLPPFSHNGHCHERKVKDSQQHTKEYQIPNCHDPLSHSVSPLKDNHTPKRQETSSNLVQDSETSSTRSDSSSNIVGKELLRNLNGQGHDETNSKALLHNFSGEKVCRKASDQLVPKLDLGYLNEETDALSPRIEAKTPEKQVNRHVHIAENCMDHLSPRDRHVEVSRKFAEASLDAAASKWTGKNCFRQNRSTNINSVEDNLRGASPSQTRLKQDQMLHEDYSNTVEAVSGTVSQLNCKHVNSKHIPAGPLETRISNTMSETSTSCSEKSQTSPKPFVDASQLNQIHRFRTGDCGLESFQINAEAKRDTTDVVPAAKEVHCPLTKESSSVQELGQAPPVTTGQKDSCCEKVETDTVRTNCDGSDNNSPHKVGGMSLVTVEWTLRRNKGCLVEAVNSNEDSATPYVSAKDQLKSLTSSESPSGKVSPRSWYSRHWSAPITPKPMLETNLAVTTSVASNDSSPASTPRMKRKQIFDVCTAVSEKLQGTESAMASDRQNHQHTADHNGISRVDSQPNAYQEKVETRTTCEVLTQPERPPRTKDCGSLFLKSEKVDRKDDAIFQTVKSENKSPSKTENSTVSRTDSDHKETCRTAENREEDVLGAEKLSMWGSFADGDGGSRDGSRRGSGLSSQSDSSGDDTQVSMPEIQLMFQDSPVHQQEKSLEQSDDCVFDLTEFVQQEKEAGINMHDNGPEEVFCDDSKRAPLSNQRDNKEERKREGMFLPKSEWTDFDKICNHDESEAKDKNREKQSTSNSRSDSYRKRGLERQKPVSSTSEELFARKYKSERKSSTDGNMPVEKGKTPKRSVTWHALVRTSEVKTETKQKPPSSVARSTSDVTNSSSKESRPDKTPRPVRQHHSDPSSMALHRTRNWLHRHHGMEDLTIVEGVPSDQSDKRASRTKSKNRHSNVSTASVDSGVIALGEEKAIMERRSSAVDIARNDSGVGMETTRVPRKTRETTDESNCADCEKVNTVIDVEEEEESPRSYRTEDTALCPRCEKRRVERKEAIQELVQTELSYGADLRVIKEEFYEPIEKAGLLTPQQLQTIFINILELIEVNDRFADKLQDAIEHAQEQGDEDYISVNIGRIFLQAANMLMAFETYCTKQPAAPAMLKTLESEKDLFRIFLEVSQTDNSALRRMHLSSFLMAPLQRITKYPLLLSRLYKSTSCRHPDRDRLLEAQQLVEEHLEHINIKTQGSGGLMRLKKKSSRTKSTSSVENIELREMALDAVSWNKDEVHFIQMGKLQVVQCGDTWARKTKVCSVHALLLVLGQMPNLQALEEKRQPSGDKPVKGGALVLIRDKGAGRFTTLRDPFFLDKCVVSTDPDSEETFEITEIYKDPYILKGEDPSDTSRWLSLLQGLSRDLGNWRKRRNALANIMIHMVSRT